MDFNNSKTTAIAAAIFLLFLAVGTAGKRTHSKGTLVEDLPAFNFDGDTDKWFMNMQLAHHSLKLRGRVAPCRSWIKETLCKICSLDGENCSDKEKCFASTSEPRVSCDPAFCSHGGEYDHEETGIHGIETQVFSKVGRSEQVLMPIVMAKKISNPISEMGEFCLLDADSSFNEGLLVLSGHKMEVTNLKVQK
jgi:hypothetical protein